MTQSYSGHQPRARMRLRSQNGDGPRDRVGRRLNGLDPVPDQLPVGVPVSVIMRSFKSASAPSSYVRVHSG